MTTRSEVDRPSVRSNPVFPKSYDFEAFDVVCLVFSGLGIVSSLIYLVYSFER